MDYDIIIIGAGVIGLSIACQISKIGKSCLVIERHPSFGWETSSRNSEVIHAGMYYPTDSLKAKFCVAGNKSLYTWCEKFNIPHKRLGKFIVALDMDGISNLEIILQNGINNGIDNLKFLGCDDFSKLEPNVKAQAAIWSPNTGIVDSHQLMQSFETIAKQNNCDFAYHHHVIGLDKKGDLYEVALNDDDNNQFKVSSKILINSAGLDSDILAEYLGFDTNISDLKIKFCKGNYFKINSRKKYLVNHLIYPVPTKTEKFSGLGIHVTLDLDGELKLGPDTEYMADRQQNYNVDDKLLEKFFMAASSYLSGLEISDLSPDQSGIRPKIQAKGDNVRDFYIHEESKNGLTGLINLIGIESPGLTCSIEIGNYVNELVSSII